MNIEFESLRELYTRVEPALETKRSEMSRSGYQYIKKEDIWNYLKEVKWLNSRNLTLAEMVSDILDTDNDTIDYHFKQGLQKTRRTAYFDEE